MISESFSKTTENLFAAVSGKPQGLPASTFLSHLNLPFLVLTLELEW